MELNILPVPNTSCEFVAKCVQNNYMNPALKVVTGIGDSNLQQVPDDSPKVSLWMEANYKKTLEKLSQNR
jgi:hypothetical protein